MSRLKKIAVSLLFIILFTTISGYIYYYLLIPQVVGWDEANHLYWGWRVFDNLRNGNFGALWATIRTQVNYPPVQSIITGVFSFLTGGFSIEKARSLSIVWFWGSVVLLWKIGGFFGEIRKIGENRNDKLPKLLKELRLLKLEQIIPVFLFITSPLVLFYSSNHMKEGLGVFLTLLTIYFYFRSRFWTHSTSSVQASQNDKRYYLLTGMVLLFTTFEKYNYGLLLAFAFGIEAILELTNKFSKSLREPRLLKLLKKTVLENLLIFGPTAGALFFWVVWPKNQFEFFFYTLRSDWNIYSLYDTSMLVHLLFFPLEIITSYSFSYIVGTLGLLGLLGVLGRLRDFRVRVLFFFFLLNLIIGTRQFINQQARYFITSVPALFLLIGVGVNEFLSHLRDLKYLDNLRKNGFLLGLLGGAGVLGVGIILFELIRLPFMVRPTATHVNLATVYGERDYQDNQFNFNKFSWPRAYQGDIYEKQTEVVRYIVDRVDLAKPVYIFGRTNEFSPPLFDLMFSKERERLSHLRSLGDLGSLSKRDGAEKPFNEYFVTLEVLPGGILDTGDYKKMNRDYSNSEIARFRAALNTEILSSRMFNEFGLKVEVWGR